MLDAHSCARSLSTTLEGGNAEVKFAECCNLKCASMRSVPTTFDLDILLPPGTKVPTLTAAVIY